MSGELAVLMDRRHAATVTENQGRYELTYESGWRSSGTPLSLSLPLAKRVHGDTEVRAFLWGLLPDNEQVIERWARTFQVSARNPFALLSHVGEDCAGAAQFALPERAADLLEGVGGVEWVEQDDVAARIRTLRKDPTAWHLFATGQFSLAGAQAKTALYLDRETGRWGVPWGATPTTHILKPAITGFDDHDLNEHLCLELAHSLGLPSARSRVESFADERAIVVDRYDRVWHPELGLIRVHQEDMCQALGLPPADKYQSEGGPSPERIIDLLKAEVRPRTGAASNVDRFVDALAFNWAIAGTDAHAKNYSVLLGGAQVQLAPLYDVASALPYDDMYLPKLRLAMKIGGEYRMEAVSGKHWRRLADQAGLDADRVLARINAMLQRVPDAAAEAAEKVPMAGALPGRWRERVAGRAEKCLRALER